MLILKILLFVVVGVLASAILPFLAIQQPLVFLLVLVVFLFFFSRRFVTKKQV